MRVFICSFAYIPLLEVSECLNACIHTPFHIFQCVRSQPQPDTSKVAKTCHSIDHLTL
jgi:hypothetical protein